MKTYMSVLIFMYSVYTVSVYVCLHVYGCTCVDLRLRLKIILNCSPIYILRQSLSLEPKPH